MWQPIGNLIPNSLKKAGVSKQVSDAAICEEFNRIALQTIGDPAKSCKAVYIKDRVIWIAVLSDSLSNELKMYEQDILKALEDEFGKKRIVGLRFMV